MRALRDRDSTREFLASGAGKAGSLFFLVLVAVSIFVLATYPIDFGLRFWNNPAVWADNPKLAPPAWVNALGSDSRAEHVVMELQRPSQVTEFGGSLSRSYAFRIDHQADEAPSFTALTISNVTYYDVPPVIHVSLARPDGRLLDLFTFTVPAPRPREELPVSRYFETPRRIFLSGEDQVVAATSDFLKGLGVKVPQDELVTRGVDRVLFGTPKADGGFDALKGPYVFTIRADLSHPLDSIDTVRLVVGGRVFGIMGTDSIGRDLAVGLLFGFPVALFIGLATSILATAAGTILGIQSGYRGGKTDAVIQRGSDLLVNIPLLPILIFLTFIIGQKLYVVMLILVAFSWPGLAITVRSMVLQMRSGQLVEAAVAMGAKPTRIMFKHIFPQTAPFIFAQLIFFTPSAILAEASLSFLGLGDPSLPTWGQILELGFRNGGVYVGYWWWVLPPGLLIVLTALTFALLALGLEPVVNPRLRRMK